MSDIVSTAEILVYGIFGGCIASGSFQALKMKQMSNKNNSKDNRNGFMAIAKNSHWAPAAGNIPSLYLLLLAYCTINAVKPFCKIPQSIICSPEVHFASKSMRFREKFVDLNKSNIPFYPFWPL